MVNEFSEAALHQRELAKQKKAVGQCDHCGAFRLDGRPPEAHFTGCWIGLREAAQRRKAQKHEAAR